MSPNVDVVWKSCHSDGKHALEGEIWYAAPSMPPTETGI